MQFLHYYVDSARPLPFCRSDLLDQNLRLHGHEGEPIPSPTRTVLILDEAVTFGGSIVSTAALIRVLDRARFRVVFGTAAGEEHVRSKLKEASAFTSVVVARKTLDYKRMAALRGALLRGREGPLKKLLVMGLYGMRLLLNVPYMLKVLYTIIRYRVDLVQINNGWGNDEAAIVCGILGIPRIRYFRGYYPKMLNIERFLFRRRPCRCISVSEYVRSRAIEDGVPPELIVAATPPAIPDSTPDRAGADTRRRYGIPPEAPVVGMFGRIIPWKGQKEFVRAAALVAKEMPDVWFLFVGDISDGDQQYADELNTLIAESGFQERVRFTGYVDDVDAHYEAVDLVAHASILPEPSGRVVFEAMSHATPLVASNLGGPKEFIDDGVDGFVVDPTDAEVFAARIMELLRNPVRRREMGELAKTKLADRFGPQAYGEAIMRVYDAALSSP